MIFSTGSFLRPTSSCLQCCRRSFAITAAYRDTELAAPPLLARFRTDMKEALKVKDNMRLNVLRGILTEITVLEKRSEAVKTDKQLYKLLSKRQKTCKDAAAEFQKARREDLVAKENGQIGVLQAYLEEFPTLPADETVEAVKDLIRWMQSKGSNPKKDSKALKHLYADGGPFHGKLVDEQLVAETFQRLITELPPWDPFSRAKEPHDRYDRRR